MLRWDDLVVEEAPQRGGAVRFVVKPGQMYPAAVADLQDAVESKRSVEGTLLKMYLETAARLPDRAWDVALVPRAQVRNGDVEMRRGVLELARMWFTELLHRSVDNVPMELKILKDVDWRL